MGVLGDDVDGKRDRQGWIICGRKGECGFATRDHHLGNAILVPSSERIPVRASKAKAFASTLGCPWGLQAPRPPPSPAQPTAGLHSHRASSAALGPLAK